MCPRQPGLWIARSEGRHRAYKAWLYETQPVGGTMAAGQVDLATLGGDAGVARWVARFYERVAQEPLLAPMFEDLARAQARQHAYFVEFFGGPALYTQQHGKPFLRFRHRHFRIGRPERDAWLRLMVETLRDEGAAADVVAAVEARLAPIADAMINHDPERQDAYFFQR